MLQKLLNKKVQVTGDPSVPTNSLAKAGAEKASVAISALDEAVANAERLEQRRKTERAEAERQRRCPCGICC